MSDFEIQLKSIFDAYNGIEIDTDEAVKLYAPVLLSLAKKEIEKPLTMKESRIQGQAVVIFGGQIGIRVGYDKQSGYCVLEFSELIGEHKAGDILEKGWKDYGTQVQFAFRDLKSIDMLRNALDYVERTLKDGELPGDWEDWFTK